LRKSDKSVLAKELKKSVEKDVVNVEPNKYVVDGGWLLHRVKWQQGGTYAGIVHQYVQYVVTHFGSNTTIVFDGYCNGQATKDHEHERRSLKAAPDVVFDENKPAYNNQSAYLTNEHNKKALVDSINHHLQSTGLRVHQALNDADTLIAKALDIAANQEPFAVVANDTDVLVLLVYHFEDPMADIIMKSEVFKRGGSFAELIPIRSICNVIRNS